MKHHTFPEGLTREDLIGWFRDGRRRSREVFSIPIPEAYYTRPIPLRNPIVFYEGHLPAFCANTVIKLALGMPGIDENYEVLFARGIDPESEDAAKSPTDVWPSRDKVQAYGTRVEAAIERILCSGPVEDEAIPQLRGGEAVLAILEHEQMHQETLLYMFHNMPYEQKIAREPLERIAKPAARRGSPVPGAMVRIPAGEATLGATRAEIGFGWDNEFPQRRVSVPEFEIGRYSVTNGEYLEFVERGGYRERAHWSESGWEWLQTGGVTHPNFWTRRDGQWFWRGMFGLVALPHDWPVWVTYCEAEAYARWKGMRVPTEAEYHRAAFGTPEGVERWYPWGDDAPDPSRGNFGFTHWDPVPAGSYPEGASAWGVHDLAGNGWEWTSTKFAPFPGFEPMASYPIYSTDFFDDEHYVLKGASPATAPQLVRRSLRNWFRPNYPYLYAKFRVARGGTHA